MLLCTSWRRNKSYNFNYKNDEEYYDIKGKSITKSLMKTPINEQDCRLLLNEKAPNFGL